MHKTKEEKKVVKKKVDKLPSNPVVGQEYIITVKGTSGTKYVSFLAKKKSGFGMWSTTSNKPGRGRPKGTSNKPVKKSAKKSNKTVKSSKK